MDTFKHLEKYIDELDELDKVRYLQFVSQNILKGQMNLKIEEILMIGDLIQKVEITCATIKKIILDTEIKGAVCAKCNKELPTMLIKHHISGVNKECPHDAIELIDDETYLQYLKEQNK